MKRMINLAPFLVALMLFCSVGCGTINLDNLDQIAESDVVIPSPGSDVGYLYVAPYDGSEPDPLGVFDLQNYYADRILILDSDKSFPIDWENAATIPADFALDDISGIKELDGNPDAYDCVLSSTAPESETFTTDGAGTNTLPTMDESWKGYGQGGCGTWSTAMCNRILGLTDPDTEVTGDEWNGIADGIGQNDSGGSKMSDQSKYYEDKGYCVNEKKFGGSEADYQEMADEINDSCDVKLFFWTRNADGSFSNGHVETVTSADAGSRSCTTNSWGEEATVSGGNDGGFDHSRDGSAFQDALGNELWPAGATEVWVSYVCECSVLESIGKLLGF